MKATSNGSRFTKPATRVVPPPLTPCDLLVLAKSQMIALVSGQAVAEVETPQLGRVVYTKADIPQLQRIIDGLAADCAALTGSTTPGRRRPISIEAWP
jgi:hypothetical protein